MLNSLLFAVTVRAQEITYNTSTYQGGANISCNGAMDGWINIVVVGGTPPYLYTWSNGSFSQNLSGIGAGSYTVQVMDAANQTVSMTIELFEPGAMGVNTVPSVYEGGYNISVQGGQNGSIEVEVGGGTPPYTYLWNTGSQEASAYELTAGTYSVTVTDMNGCTASGSRVMTEPTPLHIVSISSPQSNGYHITCNEAKTGSILLTVAGGVPPYDFRWSNGDFREDPTELGAGHYWVMVYDANHASDAAQIVLTQPDVLDATLTPVVYPNGRHLSCYGCSNGSINAAAMGGASPYQYAWTGGQTTATLTSLTSGTYSVTITDANGCSVTREMELVSPEREDWTMTGNSGTNSATNFIGTSDSTDFIIRTKNTPRLKVHANGIVETMGAFKMNTPPVDSFSVVYSDPDGTLKIGKPGGGVNVQCYYPVNGWFRNNCQNPNTSSIFKYPFIGNVGIGNDFPKAKMDVSGNFIVGAGYQTQSPSVPVNGMLVEGKVGIGVDHVSTPYQMAVGGSIICTEVEVKELINFPDYVLKENYPLKSLDELSDHIKLHGHLPELPAADSCGNVQNLRMGEFTTLLLKKIEELTLYLIAQDKRINEMEASLNQKIKKEK